MKKIIIIFSGYNLRAVVAFLRTLEKNNISYFIIAKSPDDDIFKTSYSSKVVYVRKNVFLELDDMFNGIKIVKNITNFQRCLIAPSTEALNRFYLEHKIQFDSLNCFMPIVNKSLYELVSDKFSFGKLCKKHEIIIPNEYEYIDKKKFPFVAKPRKYVSFDNKIYSPYIIRNEKELLNFEKVNNGVDFYYQEYVDGKCIYLLYYIDKKFNIFKLSQENFIQQEEGKSMIYAKISDYHHKEISLKFEKLFIQNSFKGLVMIELKVNQNHEIMIEANPRFWGPSQLFVDANYNFFEFLLCDYGFLDSVKNKNTVLNDSIYFWNDGIIDNIEKRNKIAYYNYSKNDFNREKEKMIKYEIFNRKDTVKLYKEK